VSGGTLPLDIDDGTNAYVYGPLLFGGTAPVEQIDLTSGDPTYLTSVPSGVQVAFDASGTLQEQAAYSPFGTQSIQSGTDVSPFGFQGSYTDAGTGYLYLIDRYYDPGTDQFLSIDPDVMDTGQPYAFTGDDPLNATQNTSSSVI
jgi:RHS repeat-associated protein